MDDVEQVAASCHLVSPDDERNFLRWKIDKLGRIVARVETVDISDAATLVTLTVEYPDFRWIDQQ